MNNTISLCQLAVGECASIEKISKSCRIRKRLTELGLIGGTKVVCLLSSPMGGMKAYLFRGAIIAIRDEDCQGVIAIKEGNYAKER